MEKIEKNEMNKQILNKKNIKAHLNPFIIKLFNIKSDS